MNKRSVRSFAFGLLLAVSSIGSVYYFQTDSKQPSLDIAEATSFLTDKGFVILEKSEYNTLKEEALIQNKETPSKKEINQEKAETKELPKTNPPEIETENAIINFQLEVVSGMTSNEIASKLAQNKIIEDEKDFAEYLIKNNYQTGIQVGSYSLTNRMSYDQIAKMITKR